MKANVLKCDQCGAYIEPSKKGSISIRPASSLDQVAIHVVNRSETVRKDLYTFQEERLEEQFDFCGKYCAVDFFEGMMGEEK